MAATCRHRISEAADVAAELRPFLEPLWDVWRAGSADPGRPVCAPSEAMCGFTAAFVSLAMSAIDGAEWTVRGGWPRNGGGIAGRDGRFHAHFWTVSDDGVIVDLTADQFGMPSIVVTDVHDRRYVEGFSADEIERHLPRVLPLAEAWLEEAVHAGIAPSPARLVA